jgi:hypothetical protein
VSAHRRLMSIAMRLRDGLTPSSIASCSSTYAARWGHRYLFSPVLDSLAPIGRWGATEDVRSAQEEQTQRGTLVAQRSAFGKCPEHLSPSPLAPNGGEGQGEGAVRTKLHLSWCRRSRELEPSG